ncbi:MAG: tetraacyldisaccharide 4'-kinase [uncultured bacterium]|nr:MAG: tetraacyldisaccharide 4'-kinase [uncultured bacterium]
MKLENMWYGGSYKILVFLLLPFSLLFRLLVSLRYFLFRFSILRTVNLSQPVIVVGNITVGGTGKTPFVIQLAEELQNRGYRPGIVSRGVGGKKMQKPCWVDLQADPAIVGDEALLIVQRTGCPMVTSVDRVSACQELLQKTTCNAIIADDGLQHYRLGREIEICIIDGMRQLGNGHMLPAGPLREPISRLKRVDFIVVNGQKTSFLDEHTESMELLGNNLFSVKNLKKMSILDDFKGQKVHAIAGIGNPKRFFSLLRDHQIDIIEHTFPDHYLFSAKDLNFSDNLPIIMTEKDAVKCVSFADEKYWYLRVDAKISDHLVQKICQKLELLCGY